MYTQTFNQNKNIIDKYFVLQTNYCNNSLFNERIMSQINEMKPVQQSIS